MKRDGGGVGDAALHRSGEGEKDVAARRVERFLKVGGDGGGEVGREIFGVNALASEREEESGLRGSGVAGIGGDGARANEELWARVGSGGKVTERFAEVAGVEGAEELFCDGDGVGRVVRDEAGDHLGVIDGRGGVRPVWQAAQSGFRSKELFAERGELGGGGRSEARRFQLGGGAGEGGEEEAASAGGGGIVAKRRGAGAAMGEKFGVGVGELRARGGRGINETRQVMTGGDIGEGFGGDVAVASDAVSGVEGGSGGAEEFFDLGGGEEMGGECGFGGRVFSGSAFQLIDGVEKRVAGGVGEAGVLCEGECVEEREGDAGLVGEGFLEVRLAVFGVSGVAEETAVERIADRAADDRAEGGEGGFASGGVGEKEAEQFGFESFGRIAKAAVGGIVEAEPGFAPFGEEARAVGVGERCGGFGGEKGLDGGDGFVGFGALGVGVGLPASGGAFGDGEETLLAPFFGGREVVGAFERFQFGREPDVEREAVELPDMLRVALVERDEIRALVGVDGDADEGLVEEAGVVGVAESLFQHGAAELARGETDEDVERFVFGGGAGEGFGGERLKGDGGGAAGAEESRRGVGEGRGGAEESDCGED